MMLMMIAVLNDVIEENTSGKDTVMSAMICEITITFFNIKSIINNFSHADIFWIYF